MRPACSWLAPAPRRSRRRRQAFEARGNRASADAGTRTSWSVFLKAHWRALVAAEFLTDEVRKSSGLVTYYMLFLIDLPTRVVRITGITTNPAEGWMLQVARNFCYVDDGVLT